MDDQNDDEGDVAFQRHEGKMEQYWKTLREQLHILGMRPAVNEIRDLEFLRIHAWSVVQLCDEILSVQKNPAITTTTVGEKRCG